jgi:hypothetical protein
LINASWKQRDDDEKPMASHKRWFIPPGDEKTQMKSIRSVGVKLGTKRTHFVAFSRPPPNQKKIWALLFCF